MTKTLGNAVKQSNAVDSANSTGEVHFLESYTEIPPSSIPLQKPGQASYDEWCRNLMNAGRLTVESLQNVQNLALSIDMIAAAVASSGKNLRAATEFNRSSLRQLQALNADKTISSTRTDEMVFAKFGFAERARISKHGK